MKTIKLNQITSIIGNGQTYRIDDLIISPEKPKFNFDSFGIEEFKLKEIDNIKFFLHNILTFNLAVRVEKEGKYSYIYRKRETWLSRFIRRVKYESKRLCLGRP